MIGRKKLNIDDDLMRRIDAAQSGLVQARIHIDAAQSTLVQARNHVGSWADTERGRATEALDELGSWLERARHAETPPDERLRLVTRVDAELCLYEPFDLLKADRIRIEDRLYRLHETARNKWAAVLKEYDSDQGNEQTYRQWLRSLHYEIAQASSNFERLAADRRKTLVWITLGTALIFLMLGYLFFRAFSTSVAAIGAWSATAPSSEACAATDPLEAMVLLMSSSAETLWASPTLSLLLAGMLGAIVFVFHSVLIEEKLRPENIPALLLNIVVRVGFGALYALVAVIGILTGILPLKVPSGVQTAFMFLTLIALAAGLSDKAFGSVIGGTMLGKRETKAKPDRQER